MKNWKQTLLMMAAFAASTAHAGAIDALKKFNQETNALSGHFTQVVQKKNKTQTSHGTFQILRPGLFKWDTTSPYRLLMVGDGSNIWSYDIELKQIIKLNQNETIGDSSAKILSDKNNQLESSYTLKEDGVSDGIQYVLATPKGARSNFQYIRIGFQGDTLAAIQLKDSYGNQTSTRFTNVNMKPKLSRAAFKFVPPKGINVSSPK